MSTSRLEAFSDGVLAIIITIMVLELKIPEGTDWVDIQPIIPVLLTYVFSFIYVGLYWNNHHHLMNNTEKVNGGVLWANLHWLFWLSLLPFATGFMGANHFEAMPTAIYGIILFMSAVAWEWLARRIVKNEGADSKVARAYERDKKKLGSILIYLCGIVLSFFYAPAAVALYVLVAVLWIIPDRRMEQATTGGE